MKQGMHSGHDTIFNSGGTWIRPISHLAANRQQPDDPSGVESTHPEPPVAFASPQRAALSLTTGSAALLSLKEPVRHCRASRGEGGAGRCTTAGPEKPAAYSLEYVEDLSGPRTKQLSVHRSPQ